MVSPPTAWLGNKIFLEPIVLLFSFVIMPIVFNIFSLLPVFFTITDYNKIITD